MALGVLQTVGAVLLLIGLFESRLLVVAGAAIVVASMAGYVLQVRHRPRRVPRR